MFVRGTSPVAQNAARLGGVGFLRCRLGFCFLLVFFTASSPLAILQSLASRAARLPASPRLGFLPLGFFAPAVKAKLVFHSPGYCNVCEA